MMFIQKVKEQESQTYFINFFSINSELFSIICCKYKIEMIFLWNLMFWFFVFVFFFKICKKDSRIFDERWVNLFKNELNKAHICCFFKFIVFSNSIGNGILTGQKTLESFWGTKRVKLESKKEKRLWMVSFRCSSLRKK